MDGFFKQDNQKVNLWRRPMPDAQPVTTILKDGFLRKKKNFQKFTQKNKHRKDKNYIPLGTPV